MVDGPKVANGVVEKMLTELKEPLLKFQGSYKAQNGQQYTEYRLDRELTEILLTGYSAVVSGVHW
jgi:hypothetical protein